MNLSFITWLVLTSTLHVLSRGDDSYEKIKSLEGSLFSSSTYSKTLRPIKNQTDVLQISVSFSLVAIVSLNDVTQELITNGFLFLTWTDQKISWDIYDYGGVKNLTPVPKQIWRPRMLLINTLDKRDPFEDDYTHTFAGASGHTGWIPGGLFHTYCRLDMSKFPFDVQQCHIQMCPMSHVNTSIVFIPDEEMNMGFYFPNPGWDLLGTKIEVENVDVVPGESFSCPKFHFTLKRRPDTIMLNVILPVILMSLLNNLVFFVPVESGEKISYAVTVLLSLSVFLSMVSTMTPQVTDTLPALTTYLFVLLVSSVLTVAAAIFTVFLHHKEEKEDASLKSKEKLQRATGTLMRMKAAVAPLPSKINLDSKTASQNEYPEEEVEAESGPKINKYRMISKHINLIFFVIITLLWLIMTIWFFVFTKS